MGRKRKSPYNLIFIVILVPHSERYMYTEETLKDFTLDSLVDLMVLKLEQFEKLNEKLTDFNLRVLAREEIELIQKIIDEKRAGQKTK